MNIIRKMLISIGLSEKEVLKPVVKLREDKELISYSNDKELKLITKHYENSRKDVDNYNPQLILERREIERQVKNYKIKFDFLPFSMSSINVRSASQFKYGHWRVWSEIRNLVEELHGGKCVVCGKTSFDMQDFDEKKEVTCNTECHEQWSFKQLPDGRYIQTLDKLLPLCFVCHRIHHLNQYKSDEKMFKKLMAEYCEINRVDEIQANKDFKFWDDIRTKNNSNKYLLDMKLVNKLEVECRFEELFNPETVEFNKFLKTVFISSDDED